MVLYNETIKSKRIVTGERQLASDSTRGKVHISLSNILRTRIHFRSLHLCDKNLGILSMSSSLFSQQPKEWHEMYELELGLAVRPRCWRESHTQGREASEIKNSTKSTYGTPKIVIRNKLEARRHDTSKIRSKNGVFIFTLNTLTNLVMYYKLQRSGTTMNRANSRFFIFCTTLKPLST